MRGITSSSRTLPSHSLIDEDEDGDMVIQQMKKMGKATNVVREMMMMMILLI